MTWAGQPSVSGLLTYEDGRTYWTSADAIRLHRTEVITSGAIVNLSDDINCIVIRKSVASPTTVNLPSPILGQEVVVKDGGGTAFSHNITIAALSGLLIDGQPLIRLKSNYQSVTLLADGAGWNIL